MREGVVLLYPYLAEAGLRGLDSAFVPVRELLDRDSSLTIETVPAIAAPTITTVTSKPIDEPRW